MLHDRERLTAYVRRSDSILPLEEVDAQSSSRRAIASTRTPGCVRWSMRAPFGIARWSLAQDRFESVNAALCAMLGYSEARTAGNTTVPRALPQRAERRRNYRPAEARPEAAGQEMLFRRKGRKPDSRARDSLFDFRCERTNSTRSKPTSKTSPSRGAGAANPAGAETGSSRPPGRRRGARLQQHSGGHQAVDRDDAGPDHARQSVEPATAAGFQSRRPRGRAHEADAGFQPAADDAAGWSTSTRW